MPKNYRHGNGIPDALRDLAMRIRAELRAVGDDGSYGSFRHRITVKAGWAEAQAIDNMHTRMIVVRKARDGYKKQLQKTRKDMEQLGKDITDHNLVNDTAILDLLKTADRLASGEMQYQEEVDDLRRRIRKVLKRGRRSEKNRNDRDYPLF